MILNPTRALGPLPSLAPPQTLLGLTNPSSHHTQWHATCTATDYAIGLGGQDSCDVELCVPGVRPPPAVEGAASGFCVNARLSRACHGEFGTLVGLSTSDDLKKETIEQFGRTRSQRVATSAADLKSLYENMDALNADLKGAGDT